jgi:2'-5' RNA ligase
VSFYSNNQKIRFFVRFRAQDAKIIPFFLAIQDERRIGHNKIHMIEKKSEQRYFLAIVPSGPVYDEALKLKHYFKETYNSGAALNSPPHITLHMPFKWKESKEDRLIFALKEFTSQQKSFHVTLTDFGSFEPRVIFIDVQKNEVLGDLQKNLKRFCKTELNLFNADYKEFAYHPHLTLAFRDLKKVEFYKAWEEFKDKKLEASFTINSIALLKHDGKEWRIFKNLLLAE